MQSGPTKASYIGKIVPFMPDWFLTTEPSEGGRCHFPVGKERIDAPFLRKNDPQVTLAGTSDCLWSAAAFALLL